MPTEFPDIARRVIWALVALAGSATAAIEHRLSGRYRAWLLFVLIGAAGLVTMRVSPFTFSGGDHYIEGVIVAAGAALMLGGYAVAALIEIVGRGLFSGVGK